MAALVGGDQGSAARLKSPAYAGPRPLLRGGSSNEERF